MVALFPHKTEAAPPEAHASHVGERKAGEIVRVRREDGAVDLVEVVSAWTPASSNIPMLTVVRRPFGFYSFDVRADTVLTDDEPDVRAEPDGCDTTATWRIGPLLTCEAHRQENAVASWKNDARHPMTKVDPDPSLLCGRLVDTEVT